MGRHGSWTEALHPRADDGKFGHGSGGHSGGDNGRGMPDVIAGADVPIRDGDELAMDFHADGSASIITSKTSVQLPESSLSDLVNHLKHIGSEETQVGDEAWVKSIERDANGRPTGSSLAAVVRKDGEGNYSLRLAPTSNPSVEEMRNSPAVRLNDKDITKIDDAILRGETAARVDTGNGDVDLHITDDKKFAFRQLGDDGRPFDVKLNPKSFGKISHAIDVVIDGWDENDTTLADDAVVTERIVSTNAGKVKVELIGGWKGTNPGDQLRIVAVDDSWGIFVDSAYQDSFTDAWSTLQDAGESLEIYDPSMKFAK